jgi:hypothetical protein
VENNQGLTKILPIGTGSFYNEVNGQWGAKEWATLKFVAAAYGPQARNPWPHTWTKK